MARITGVVLSPGRGGYFFDDQRAIKAGAKRDGFFYLGRPVTPGFSSVRMPSEAVSVMLRLDDGQTALGDCTAIQYSGAGGRYPVLNATEASRLIGERIAPMLVGRELGRWRELAGEVEGIEVDGKAVHTAIRYGVSQALLDAVARSKHVLPCEVIAEEYGLELSPEPVRIFCQSGDDRYDNVDKMIMKEADVLPHGLINNVPDKLGPRGEKLLEYVRWLRSRIIGKRASPRYAPELHIDVYGTPGLIFENDPARIAAYIATLGEAAEPFALRIEGPLDAGERLAQHEALAAVRRELKKLGSKVGIVADEWCNTMDDIRSLADNGCVDMIQIKTPVLGGIQNSVEAVLHCRSAGVMAYLGGSCTETDVSARMCVHAALATRPHQMLAKPGMGVDEGYSIVRNEMMRTVALLRARQSGGSGR